MDVDTRHQTATFIIRKERGGVTRCRQHTGFISESWCFQGEAGGGRVSGFRSASCRFQVRPS